MARFTNTFPVNPDFVTVPVYPLKPIFRGIMANAMAHLGISSTKYELTIADDGTPMLSMKNIRDVVKVSAYLHNHERKTAKRRKKVSKI